MSKYKGKFDFSIHDPFKLLDFCDNDLMLMLYESLYYYGYCYHTI